MPLIYYLKAYNYFQAIFWAKKFLSFLKFNIIREFIKLDQGA